MISKNWRKKSEIYKLFALNFWDECNNLPCPYDFSEKAAKEVFEYETFGKGSIEIDTFSSTHNGYAIGKKWCDVRVNDWLELLESPGWLTKIKYFILDGKIFPEWWLDSILSNFLRENNEEYMELCGKSQVYEDYKKAKLQYGY